MNIFILDYDFNNCCKYMVDKHIIKMQLESAQLLSTAVRISGIDKGYQITHKNHPCSIWVRSSLSNWLWLKELSIHMYYEYMYRFGKKEHKSHRVIMSLPTPNLYNFGLTPFVLVMPNYCKTNNPIISYRQYYINEKQHIAKWTNRDCPYWWRYNYE
jgi:hypothetical protein